MKTPGKKAANWIENFCVVPAGFDKGQHVRLSVEQRETVRRIFDTDESPGEITAPLSG
jgi:tryptophanyl-tRNA synthetase